jgi:hypothetical protein
LHRVTLVLIFLSVLPAVADYDGPAFSGFFDAGVTALLADETTVDGRFGALEVDLEGSLADWADFAAGLVLEKEDSAVEVEPAAVLLDLHLPEADGFLATAGVYLGNFDVPFGWDFLRYATPDRPTVSAPLTTSTGFEDGMTELGFAAYARTAFFDLDAYLLYLPTGEPEVEGEPAPPDRWAYGARLDVIPGLDWLHVGGSAVLANEGAEDEEVDSSGYYAEAVYRFDEVFAPVYLFARYGAWDPDTGTDDDELTRIAGGLGYAPIEWLAFKLEYTAEGEPGDVKNDALTLDAVVAF